MKVEDSPQLVRRGKPRMPLRKTFKNGDLPDGCQTGDAWRHAFVPTYLWWVATRLDPWCLDDDEAIEAMQAIWDTIYDTKDTKIVHVVTLNDAVCSIVNKPILFVFI